MRKNLAKALVLGKVDYADALFYNKPKYHQNQMQRVQNAISSFVHRKHTKETDVLTLNSFKVALLKNYDVKCFLQTMYQC